MNTHDHADAPLSLLTRALTRFVAADGSITHVDAVPLGGGMSGAAVWRYHVQYSTAAGHAATSFVTKVAESHEWHTLLHLNMQQQPNVPFACALDNAAGERVLMCMQDVGNITRPTSLDPITDEYLRREANGLAVIHSANAPHAEALHWLPRMDRAFIEEMLWQRTWRPVWEAALANHAFCDTFRHEIPRVEAAAAAIVSDMAALCAETESQTLIHADINPSNVLVQDGMPYFIDWQAAMLGPFYVDLPHHHCTLAQAELYRQALATFGWTIAPPDFAERYRVAARYIGLRYMWWTLEYWLEDHTQTAWVQHYIGLVTGDGLS
ncbi:MAG TPA: aminoglycoside phosphotransferase family protein [Roseiflexaceae bacterium]|jgi:thiamine kinase-like enzyme|nr:aminoglycoside phosphotransferase family protein [Roseiflexaceae bacterium]